MIILLDLGHYTKAVLFLHVVSNKHVLSVNATLIPSLHLFFKNCACSTREMILNIAPKMIYVQISTWKCAYYAQSSNSSSMYLYHFQNDITLKYNNHHQCAIENASILLNMPIQNEPPSVKVTDKKNAPSVNSLLVNGNIKKIVHRHRKHKVTHNRIRS